MKYREIERRENSRKSQWSMDINNSTTTCYLSVILFLQVLLRFVLSNRFAN